MDWSKGFSASYIMMQVNPQTWEDEGEIPLAELIQRFNNKEVSISVGYKEELY